MQQIFHGVAVRILFQRFRVHVLGITVEHDFTTQSSCIRTDIYQVVCRTHNLLVVLYDYHRITQTLKLFQHPNQSFRITGMESDTRLVENVERTYERATQ